MGVPFHDITLYTPTIHKPWSREYKEEVALLNYAGDLYVRKMHGYKPPKTARVCIQPGFHEKWKEGWKNGSIAHIAPKFHYEKFQSLEKDEKLKYLLDLIQTSMVQLSRQYDWDESVFIKAYEEIIASKYLFRIDYSSKLSRDKKKKAFIRIEKSEIVTTIFVSFQFGNQEVKVKLLDKVNQWYYDSAYRWAKASKWFDNDRFGFTDKESDFSAWYSLSKETVEFERHGEPKTVSDLRTFFDADRYKYD
jgi:hypothetical protein